MPLIPGTRAMESGCRGSTPCKHPIPDFAMLHPGYDKFS
jgi:hypothetical protein